MSKKKSSSIVPVVIFLAVVGIGVFTLIASFAATPGSEVTVSPEDLQQSSSLQQSVIEAAKDQSINQ